jgi:hypothetical protein
LSFFGDSNASSKPRSAHVSHQHKAVHDYLSQDTDRPSRSAQNVENSAFSAASSNTTSRRLPELLNACTSPRNARTIKERNNRILEVASEPPCQMQIQAYDLLGDVFAAKSSLELKRQLQASGLRCSSRPGPLRQSATYINGQTRKQASRLSVFDARTLRFEPCVTTTSLISPLGRHCTSPSVLLPSASSELHNHNTHGGRCS